MYRVLFAGIICVFFMSSAAYSQGSLEQYYEQIREYEPNEEYPYGRINPIAVGAVKQFDFMVGVCECQDSLLTPDGSWFTYPSIWQAKYFLNGMAIQDNNFNARTSTTNLRVYDINSETWKVTYLQVQTGYFSGVWEGSKIGDDIVLTQKQKNSKGEEVTSKLTFFNISDEGYSWKSETINSDGSTRVGWKKKCTKRKE